MFDPDKWELGRFEDAELVAQGGFRVITLTVPFGIVVALVNVVVRNGDTGSLNFDLQYNPGALSDFARVTEGNAVAGTARSYLPERFGTSSNSKLQGPILFPGSTIIELRQTDPVANAGGAVIETALKWLQSKFGAKSSGLLVPVGTTV